jgi:CubicO group peptidase (beta-lactamase class C family)
LRDYGRLGQMMLDEGRLNSRQVVPASWVRQSTAMVPFGAGPMPDRGYGYGFQWWNLDDTGAFSAWGLQGQFIYVHPASRTVIVKLSFFPPEGTASEDAAMEQTLAYFKTLDNWSGGHVAP